MKVSIVADSITSKGDRLTTAIATYWRGIHAEVMTHREMSRNASSSRAIPVAKMLADLKADPFLPMHWGKNQPGMQAREELSEPARSLAEGKWSLLSQHTLEVVDELNRLGLHKQIANRPTEWFGHITLLVSSTEWPNFLGQRCSKEAEPHMEALAEAFLAALNESEPMYLEQAEWHRPFITPKDVEWAHVAVEAAKKDGFNDIEHPEQTHVWMILNKISVARCARVSYKNHDQTDPDPAKDVELYERLLKNHHMSPFEHVARPEAIDNSPLCGNFKGWEQWRKFVSGEKIRTFDRFIVKSAERARQRRYNVTVPCGVFGCTTPRLEIDTMCKGCLDDYRQDPEAYK